MQPNGLAKLERTTVTYYKREEPQHMTKETEQAILDVIKYGATDDCESTLEQTLENALAEKYEDLSSLKEELQDINNFDTLGQTIANVVWEQFTNQMAVTIGEDFIAENGGLTLDLSNDAHIQTTTNFAVGDIASHNTEIDYQNRYDTWQANFERNPDGSIMTHKSRTGREEATLVKGARKPFDEGRPKGSVTTHTDMDHTKSAAFIIRNPGANAHLPKEQQIAFANSEANLNEIDSSLNKSKSDLEMSEWLDTPNARGQKPKEIFNISEDEEKRLREKEAEANAEFDKCMVEGEKRSIEAGKRSQKQEFYRIGKHALKAAFMSLLASLAKEIISKLILWLRSTEKSIKTFVEYIKQAILTFIGKLKQLLVNATDDVLTAVATAIIGPVVGLLKKTIVMLKQSWRSLKEAIEYLMAPENKGKSMSELMPQVGIIVITGLSGIGTIALSEFIEKSLLSVPFLAIEIPLLGSPANLIGTLMGAIICGVIGAIAINIINRQIAEQQKQANFDAQIEKKNEILALQDSLIGVKADKVASAVQNTVMSVVERHNEAAVRMTKIAESVLEPSGTEKQLQCSNELDRLLQGS